MAASNEAQPPAPGLELPSHSGSSIQNTAGLTSTADEVSRDEQALTKLASITGGSQGFHASYADSWGQQKSESLEPRNAGEAKKQDYGLIQLSFSDKQTSSAGCAADSTMSNHKLLPQKNSCLRNCFCTAVKVETRGAFEVWSKTSQICARLQVVH